MTATKQQPIAGYRISDPSDPTIKPWLSETPDDNGYRSEPLYAGAAPAAVAGPAIDRAATLAAIDDISEPSWTGYECPNTWADGLSAARAVVQSAPAAPALEAPQVEYPHEQMDAMALARYNVVPSNASMLWSHAVVAGDGAQQLYVGREVECQNMARKFAGAFLDGAFAFHSMSAAPALEAPAAPVPATVAWLNKPILVQDGEKVDDLPPTVDFERHAAAHEWNQAEPLVRLSDAVAYAKSLAAASQAPNCTRCSGSGEDPEGYLTHGRGPDDHTVDGPCRECGGNGSVLQAPAAPDVTADALLKRATDLHEKGFMPWVEAEELALSEIGIEEAAIDELIREGTHRAVDEDFFLTGADEIRSFTRTVLVHQGMLHSGLSFAQAAPAAPAVDAETIEDAERFRAMGRAVLGESGALGRYPELGDDATIDDVRAVFDAAIAAQAAAKGASDE